MTSLLMLAMRLMFSVMQEEKRIASVNDAGRTRGNASNKGNPSVTYKPNSNAPPKKVIIPRWPTFCMLQGSWTTTMIRQSSRVYDYFSALPYS